MREEAPNSDNEPKSNSPHQEEPSLPRGPKWRRRILLGLGSVLLVGLGGGLTYGWFFMQRQLTPLVERELTDLFNRPVKVGQVEGFSGRGLRFGASKILATPTDPAYASVVAVDVAINPIQLLMQRQLNLNVNLVEPDIYLEQGKDKDWLLTKLDSTDDKKEKLIKVEVQTIRFEDADVVLVARSLSKTLQPPVKLRVPSGEMHFPQNTDLIKFDLVAKPIQGGNIKVSGVGNTETEAINLGLAANHVQATDVGHLIPLPFKLEAGQIGGNLEVQLRKEKPAALRGIASLQSVTARLPTLTQAFAQSNGQLRFNGYQIRLDNISSRFGSIPGVANGLIDTQKEILSLKAQTQPIQVTQVIQALKLKAPPVPILGEIKADIQVTGTQKTPELLINAVATKQTRIDKVDFRSITANLKLIESNLAITQLQAFPTVGGRLIGNGLIKLPQNKSKSEYVFNVEAINVPPGAIASLYNTQLPTGIGLVSGQAKFIGTLENPNNLQANGLAYFRLGGGTVNVNEIQYINRRWQADVRLSGVQIASLESNQVFPAQVRQGRLNGVFKVFGGIDSFQADTIRATGTANIAIARGLVTATDLQLANGRWKTNLQAQGLQIHRLFPDIPPQLWGILNGTVKVAGRLESSLEEIRGTGQANIALANGLIQANRLQLAKGRWTTDLQAQGIQVSRLFPNIPPQFRGYLDGRFNLAGNIDNPLAGMQGNGQGRLNLSDGTVTAENVQLVNRQFQAVVVPRVQLARFSPQLRGQLGGRLSINGNLDNLSANTIQARGRLTFSEGIALIDRPLITVISWNRQRLTIQEATANGFTAKGFADINVAVGRENAIRQFQLDVNAEGLNLQALPLSLPQTVAKLNYVGQVDFEGIIAGTPKKPKIEGDIALRNFRFERLDLIEPVLTGTIKLIPGQGGNLQLTGTNDQIQLALNPNYQPTSFLFQINQMQASGSRQGDLFLIDASQVQVGLLKDLAIITGIPLPQAVIAQPLSGELSGHFALNLKTFALSGNQVAIALPQFGTIKGDRLSSNFRYTKGDLSFWDGQFEQGQSQYLFNGSLIQHQQGPQLQAKVTVNQGQIQDVLESLQIFELSDFSRGLQPPTYDKATALYTSPSPSSSPPSSLLSVGQPKASIFNQLRRLSEIETLLRLQRQQRQEASPLPELSNLQGTFDGTLTVSGSFPTGIQADFNLEGNKWQWGTYRVDRVTAKGNLNKGSLTLEPVSIKSGNSFLGFSGKADDKTLSGQLNLVNIPLALIEEFVDLPTAVGFGGLLNGGVTLTGSRDNPQAQGELVVIDATINQTSLQATKGNFNYNKGRLNFFASSLLTGNTNPLTIQGSFPYQLPFTTVKPDGEQFSLSFNVQNEGLILLNILTGNSISWVAGQGNVELDISGTFNAEKEEFTQVQAEGVASLENATIAAQILPEAPLTEVNSKILFNFDRIDVESFKGKFSGGEVTIAGTLPLKKTTPQENPLTVNLRNLAFNFKGLYQGGVQGEVKITGSVLEPDIGGEVDLFNGRILLEDTSEDTGRISTDEEGIAEATEFAGLKLVLGDNIRITRPPILDFIAMGSLTLNGSFDSPRPEGTILLESGQVNLFTTQLRLDNGYDNVARFIPERGLDPYLDVQLIGSVIETTRSTAVVRDPASADVNDAPAFDIGGLETIRVQASIEGYSSQLTNSIELTSTPPRSQKEIIALLGGGFVNTLGQGGGTLGLANLAGSALFGGVQNAITEALGLSEFRIFPTQIINEQERTERTANPRLGVAVEAGVDVSDNLSVGVLKIVNTDQPPQFGVRYRLNDNTVLRGSSNFDDDSRAIIEYERRF